MLTRISSNVGPCTLCIVVARASVSGNCSHLISEPRLSLAKNATSYLFSCTALANLAQYCLVWRPTLLFSNFTSMLVTLLLLLVTTLPLAPFTRPSETSTSVISMTCASTSTLRVPCRPPVLDLLSDWLVRLIWLVWPAIELMAIIAQCVLSGVMMSSMSVFCSSTSAFMLEIVSRICSYFAMFQNFDIISSASICLLGHLFVSLLLTHASENDQPTLNLSHTPLHSNHSQYWTEELGLLVIDLRLLVCSHCQILHTFDLLGSPVDL